LISKLIISFLLVADIFFYHSKTVGVWIANPNLKGYKSELADFNFDIIYDQ